MVHRRGSSTRWPAAFTLVELMVALAIASILLGIGVPFTRDLVQAQKITAAANDFFASMHLARAEAMRRGTRVDMVPLDGAGDWAKGWVIFVDANNNLRPDAGEETIFLHDPLPPGISVKASLTDTKVQYLAYGASGRTRTHASSQRPQFGNFTFTLDKQVRKITLNFLGRARICNPARETSC